MVADSSTAIKDEHYPERTRYAEKMNEFDAKHANSPTVKVMKQYLMMGMDMMFIRAVSTGD